MIIQIFIVDGELYIIANDINTQLLESKKLKEFDKYIPYVRQYIKRIGDMVNDSNDDISPLKRMKII
jgi:hypothetical protein